VSVAIVRPIVLAVLAAALLEQPSSAVGSQSAPYLPVWMTGCWSGERGAEKFHERWTGGDDSTLLGVAHTTKAGKLAAFEFLRVVVKDGRAVYVAQPNGAPPTEFAATAATATRVVFENPAHDFPKRVIYEKSGADRLTASIDGGSEKANRIEYPMTRAACDR
jgi:hypothetical protein